VQPACPSSVRSDVYQDQQLVHVRRKTKLDWIDGRDDVQRAACNNHAEEGSDPIRLINDDDVL
jgi:hypothetical protein